MQAHTESATSLLKFEDARNGAPVYLFANQVFAVTVLPTTSTTVLVGPANAILYVKGSLEEVTQQVANAIKHEPATKEK